MKDLNRLKILSNIVCFGMLGGICFSFELWFPVNRTFPRAPLVFSLPADLVVSFERIFSAALVGALLSIIFSRRVRFFSIVAVVSLVSLILFDQTRLQPWVYQYLLLVAVFALHDGPGDEAADQTIALAQLLIAALYVWSGVQKLNFSFAHETLPALLTPLADLFPTIRWPFVWLGLGIASIEVLTGAGLLFRRTRNLSVCLAIVAHTTILGLLVAKNYNSIVWVWNAALMVLVVAAFWRSDAVPGRIFRTNGGWRVRTARSIAAASVLLPILSFWGWWDVFLSGALYSGNVEIAVIRINQDLLVKLPPPAQQVVFQIANSGAKMLPLFEWSMAELNVPVYPEQRVFRQIARQVCRTADDKIEVELIIRQRPAILDGSYRTKRISCAGLEKEAAPE